MRASRVMLWLATAAVVGGLSVGVAVAGKPPADGGGTGGGTIYFQTQGRTWTMNSDGSSKTALPAGVSGEPSRGLHGGHRWFLYASTVGGGNPGDIFAVRGDGAGLVQLTTQTNMTSATIRWAPNDAAISWTGNGGVSGQEGVFVAATVFDGSGNLTGLDAQPTAAAVLVAGADAHDWAPDGDRLVVGDTSRALWIATVSSGAVSRLATTNPGSGPVWSPDGTLIAFVLDGIFTIAPDGSGERVIASKKPGPANFVGGVVWSPSGTHVVFYKAGSILGDDRWDVYRANSSGSQKTNLTDDLDTRVLSGSAAYPVGWR